MFLQLLLCLTLLLFLFSLTLYYAAVYMLLSIITISIFLAYYNLEVLTGFLLVVEFTAFFVIILFLLALNFKGALPNYDKIVISLMYIIVFLYLYFFSAYSKPASLDALNPNHYWDDYYLALEDDIMNDIFGLYLSYYCFNGVLFFVFACIIFIVSICCINLFKILRFDSQKRTIQFKYVLNFFKDLVNFSFLRKQNVTNQTKRRSATRLVKSGGKFVKPAEVENVTKE